MEEARHLAQTLADDDEQQDLVTTIESKLLESGFGAEALSLARATIAPHARTFALLSMAARHSQERLPERRALLLEAVAAQDSEQDSEMRAVAFREVGRALKDAGLKREATTVWKRAIAGVGGSGSSHSSTIADISEELARLGELRVARTAADMYCEDGDRLRVYATILFSEPQPPHEVPLTDETWGIF